MAGTGYFIRCNQAFPRTLFSTERQTPHTPSIAVMHENELRLLAISGHASCLGATSGLAGLKGVDLLAVDGAGDAVLELEVHLGDRVLSEDGSVRDVTDGGGLDHVADGESLDGLVLRSASRAVGATDRLDVAPAVLVAAVGRALLDHLCDLRRVGSAGMFYLLKLLESCEVTIVGGPH